MPGCGILLLTALASACATTRDSDGPRESDAPIVEPEPTPASLQIEHREGHLTCVLRSLAHGTLVIGRCEPPPGP